MVWEKGKIKEGVDEWGNWEYKTDKNNLSLLTIHPYSLYPYIVLLVLSTIQKNVLPSPFNKKGANLYRRFKNQLTYFDQSFSKN